MSSGRYQLLLRAGNGYGAYSEKITVFALNIIPPFWQRTGFLVICGILILAGALLYVRGRINRIRRKEAEKTLAVKRMAEMELQSLRSQLNPHFMFNSLNAIQELILLEENEKSHTYLARFAKLLRILLENTEEQFITLNREIDFLNLYLSLESLRIPNLRYSITVDSAIETSTTMIPNMILQPYIENALWHGLSYKEGERKLELNIHKRNGVIVYDVKDNGVGRKNAMELKSLYRKEHKSKGMELLIKRFKLLSEEFGSDIQTEINDLVQDGKVAGTLVQIRVPQDYGERVKNEL